jgi:integrase/recombinase XerD
MSLRDDDQAFLTQCIIAIELLDERVVAKRRPPGRNPFEVYLARLRSPRSRQTMAAALERLAELLTGGRCSACDCPWWELRYQETAALRARLTQLYSPASTNKHLSALRGVLREAWRLELMEAEAFHRAIDVACVQAETLPAGRDLSTGEIAALVRVCRADPLPAGARDAALFALLSVGGLRRSEAVALDLGDYHSTEVAVTVRHGKGGKQRRIYIDLGSRQAIDEWLTYRGPTQGPLLTPINKAGKITIRRLSPQTVLDICRRRAGEAAVELFSPHDLRRTMVGDLLDAGADLATVQRLAGHGSPSTTSRYDRRGETVKRQAVGRLHFPWRRRDEGDE